MPRTTGSGKNGTHLAGMNDRPICYAPFIAMYANQYGEFSPCCISRKFNNTTAEEYWSSKELAEFRQEMLNGRWPTGCDICKNKSQAGLPSSVDAWDRAYDDVGSPSLGDPQVRFLDLRTSNLCNLKCRMCGPGSSSQWNAEVADNPELRKWHRPVREEVMEDLGYFVGLDLYQIKLLGGEPTIDPIVMSMMKELVNKGRVPKIRFTTNGTNLNRRFAEMMARFDEVYVTFSVDAVGKTFEYIRTNASWDRVESNIMSVLGMGAIHHLEFNTILMPYNVFGLVDLLSWYRNLHSLGHRFRVSFDNSETPNTGLEAVLPHHLEREMNRVRDYLSGCDDAFLDQILGITDLVGIMGSIRFDEKSHNAFKAFNSDLDRIRDTDITLVSPYLVDYR